MTSTFTMKLGRLIGQQKANKSKETKQKARFIKLTMLTIRTCTVVLDKFIINLRGSGGSMS